MSKLNVEAERVTKENSFGKKSEKLGRVENFMGGYSYESDPITTLKMVTSSSIFGEPSYYREDGFKEPKKYVEHELVKKYSLNSKFKGMNTVQIMEKVIDDALDYDFGATLEWAVELRKDYYVRTNPQVIMVKASKHPNRVEWTKKNPGKFAEIEDLVMSRADEPGVQLSYYLYKYGGNNNIPNVLKRAWKKVIENMNRYQMAKYQNVGTKLVDVVRLCHAGGKLVEELVKGTLTFDDDNQTWEKLSSSGKDWEYILKNAKVGHMALIRNLHNIFSSDISDETAMLVLDKIKSGVLHGKQFPFRYATAFSVIENSEKKLKFKGKILDTLQECIDISIGNMPKLKGKVMCLSDNSGSAWGGFTSEYGNVKVAEIGNLSSVITAMCSDEGYVGAFGDKLEEYPISHRDGALTQADKISKQSVNGDKAVGGNTENGIWLFFKKAIDLKEHWDTIFIYSDQQAGHGGLYGTEEGYREYKSWDCNTNNSYIDVMKLVDMYRKQVNPKVNIFSVQTAGYTDAVIPENFYRGAVLYGWTGKESVYADKLIKLWNDLESNGGGNINENNN